MVIQIETKRGAYERYAGSSEYEERGAGFPGLSLLGRTPSRRPFPLSFVRLMKYTPDLSQG